jgi:hypothetical protein
MPESPAYYSSGASSPSEAITPYEENFPLTGFEQQQSEESYGYGPQMTGYSYMDVPSSESSPPPSAYPYYPNVQQPLKDGYQYSSHMEVEVDYSAFLQPNYTA